MIRTSVSRYSTILRRLPTSLRVFSNHYDISRSSATGLWNCLQIRNFARASSQRTQKPPEDQLPNDPYELLGIPRNATAKEIKIAYFNVAKKYHPDLNPDDPKAKEKFQKVSAAYELLSDDTRRRAYDANGFTKESAQSTYGATGTQQAQHAEEVFRSVQQDVEVIKEALESLGEELRDEAQYFVDNVRARDWDKVNETVSANKGLIFGIIVPTALLIRYPPAVFTLLRLLYAGGTAVITGLIASGNLELVARVIWRRIVAMSLEQKKRVDAKKGR